MSPPFGIDAVVFLVAALVGLVVLGCLRVLAFHYDHGVRRHDLKVEVEALRARYFATRRANEEALARIQEARSADVGEAADDDAVPAAEAEPAEPTSGDGPATAPVVEAALEPAAAAA